MEISSSFVELHKIQNRDERKNLSNCLHGDYCKKYQDKVKKLNSAFYPISKTSNRYECILDNNCETIKRLNEIEDIKLD